MAFLGSEDLIELLKKTDIISDFDKKKVKSGAYEMSLGNQVFLTDSPPSKSIKELKENEIIQIKPGQFALLLTKEYVKIPKDKIAFISIKAGIKFKGLVNVSGFHVDPGFEGNLLFSVYNAGPSTIVLSSGESYFPIWFSELTGQQDYNGKHEKQNKIPNSAIEALSQNEIASPNVLSKRIDDMEKDYKFTDYIAKTALGLLVALFLKFGVDSSTREEGFDEGVEFKRKEIFSDSIINQKLIEKKNLIKEIDSLSRIKTNLQEVKTRN